AVWVATIQFGHGSARLDERDLGVLQQVVEVWERLGGRLRVVGHASGRAGGSDRIKQQMANFQASLARANVVAQTLMGLGVGPSDVIVEAQSDGDPLYRETTPAGEAGNRRAEIFIVR
ncbi:MAG: OmpA family protein, partial [Alphaproteobacteria bacterium]